MIAVEPQGFVLDDANVERLCALGQVSRAGYIAISVRTRKSARTRTCATSSSASRSTTAITAIAASPSR